MADQVLSALNWPVQTMAASDAIGYGLQKHINLREFHAATCHHRLQSSCEENEAKAKGFKYYGVSEMTPILEN